jgi:hypothetical protein
VLSALTACITSELLPWLCRSVEVYLGSVLIGKEGVTCMTVVLVMQVSGRLE